MTKVLLMMKSNASPYLLMPSGAMLDNVDENTVSKALVATNKVRSNELYLPKPTTWLWNKGNVTKADAKAETNVETNNAEEGLFKNLVFLRSPYTKGSKTFIPVIKLAANIGNLRGCKAFTIVFFILGIILSYLPFFTALTMALITFGRTR